jgi:thioredoxin-like negative regulator of GroEL
LLGRVWLKLGNTVEAANAFAQAMRLAPAMAEPVLDLAELQISTGKTTEARNALTALLAREDLPALQRARAEALMAR